MVDEHIFLFLDCMVVATGKEVCRRPGEFLLAYHNRGGSRSLRPHLEKWGMKEGQEIPRESYLSDELLSNPNYLSISVVRFCVPCE